MCHAVCDPKASTENVVHREESMLSCVQAGNKAQVSSPDDIIAELLYERWDMTCVECLDEIRHRGDVGS